MQYPTLLGTTIGLGIVAVVGGALYVGSEKAQAAKAATLAAKRAAKKKKQYEIMETGSASHLKKGAVAWVVWKLTKEDQFKWSFTTGPETSFVSQSSFPSQETAQEGLVQALEEGRLR